MHTAKLNTSTCDASVEPSLRAEWQVLKFLKKEIKASQKLWKVRRRRTKFAQPHEHTTFYNSPACVTLSLTASSPVSTANAAYCLLGWLALLGGSFEIGRQHVKEFCNREISTVTTSRQVDNIVAVLVNFRNHFRNYVFCVFFRCFWQTIRICLLLGTRKVQW